LKEDGSIQPITARKNDFLDMMGARSNDVQRYIKDNRLSFDKKTDVASAVGYYNSFFK
jgi:hypothetical protein